MNTGPLRLETLKIQMTFLLPVPVEVVPVPVEMVRVPVGMVRVPVGMVLVAVAVAPSHIRQPLAAGGGVVDQPHPLSRPASRHTSHHHILRRAPHLPAADQRQAAVRLVHSIRTRTGHTMLSQHGPAAVERWNETGPWRPRVRGRDI